MKTTTIVPLLAAFIVFGSTDAARRGLRRRRPSVTAALGNSNNQKVDPHTPANDLRRSEFDDVIEKVRKKKIAPFRAARGPHHKMKDVKDTIDSGKLAVPPDTMGDLPNSFDDIVDVEKQDELHSAKNELPDSFDDIVEVEEQANVSPLFDHESDVAKDA